MSNPDIYYDAIAYSGLTFAVVAYLGAYLGRFIFFD